MTDWIDPLILGAVVLGGYFVYIRFLDRMPKQEHWSDAWIKDFQDDEDILSGGKK
jgi:hypothetical protein